MPIAISLHILAAVIWVGGMFFAYVALRPVAASQLDPSVRLTLWASVFARFFPWVFICIISLLATGFWMISLMGGMAAIGIHIHIMLLVGIVMMLLFLHVYFSPFKKLKTNTLLEDWPTAAAALNHIRKLILVNLALGLLVIIIASAGRFL
jgi:uncharacterized membrane protein